MERHSEDVPPSRVSILRSHSHAQKSTHNTDTTLHMFRDPETIDSCRKTKLPGTVHRNPSNRLLYNSNFMFHLIGPPRPPFSPHPAPPPPAATCLRHAPPSP